jgi:hypothetical protein
MTENTFEKRLKLGAKIRHDYRWTYIFVGITIAFIFGLWLGSRLFGAQSGYWVNIFNANLV